MLQIHVKSTKNDLIYRKFVINEAQSLFEFEFVLSLSFQLVDEPRTKFLVMQAGGNTQELSLPETNNLLVGSYLKQPGDKLYFVVNNQYKLEIEVEALLNEEGADRCLEGDGNILTNRKKKIDLDMINQELAYKFEAGKMDFNSLDQMVEADFGSLIELSAELNDLKPWRFFNNEDIIAIMIEDFDSPFFVSVLGAGETEYGLMIYAEDSYPTLMKILNGQQPSKEDMLNLTGFVISFVDREELEDKDYLIIKDHGFSFRGKKRWIQFRSYIPGTVAANPTFSEVEVMKLVVFTMIQLTEDCLSGEWEYPEVPDHMYPVLKISRDGEIQAFQLLNIGYENHKQPVLIELNDLQRAQYKRKQKAKLQMEFDLFYLSNPVAPEKLGEREKFPVVCVALERGTGEVIAHNVIPFPKVPFITQQLFMDFVMDMPIRPNKIFVTKEVKEVLQPLCKLLGIELVGSELPNIQLFKEFMANEPTVPLNRN